MSEPSTIAQLHEIARERDGVPALDDFKTGLLILATERMGGELRLPSGAVEKALGRAVLLLDFVGEDVVVTVRGLS